MAAPERGDEEAGGAPAAVEHVGQQELGRVGRAGVVDLEVDPRVAADVDPGRPHRPSTRTSRVRLRTQSHASTEQAERDDPEDRQLERPEQPAGEQQARTRRR